MAQDPSSLELGYTNLQERKTHSCHLALQTCTSRDLPLDAVLFEPSRGASRVGRARIAQFYRSTIARVKPKMIAVAYVGAGLDCAVELAVERPVRGRLRYVLASVDRFTVGADGRVVRLLVFTSPSGPRVVTPKLD